jgi:hypothetical protein
VEGDKNSLMEKNNLPPLRDPDNTFAISNTDKANIFTPHLAENFSPHPDITILKHTNHIKQLLDTTLLMAFPTKHSSLSELLFIINKLPKNKSPGHDLITN